MPRLALTVSRSSSTETVFPLYSKEASDASADFVSTVVLAVSVVSVPVSAVYRFERIADPSGIEILQPSAFLFFGEPFNQHR